MEAASIEGARKVRIGDIVALPDDKEWKVFTAAYDLVSRIIRLNAYHADTEERLDTWLSRDNIAPFAGVKPPHGLSLYRASTRKSVSHDGSAFDEEVFGPWVQYICLSKPDYGITLVHELAHLIDRYHEHPRTTHSVHPGNPNFEDFFEAYRKTQSASQLMFIRSRIEYKTEVKGEDEKVVVLVEKPFAVKFGSGESLVVKGELLKTVVNRAWDCSLSHEVFARCLTALAVYSADEKGTKGDESEIVAEYYNRLGQDYNKIIGAVLSRDDYDIIKIPLLNGIKKSGWFRLN